MPATVMAPRKGDTRKPITARSLPERAVKLAAEILQQSTVRTNEADRANGERMASMLEDESGKAFTIALADEVLRFGKHGRAARRFRDLLERFGLPSYLSAIDRLLLRTGALVSRVFPWIVMPQVAAQVRRESSNVILPGEDEALIKYLRGRKTSGTRVNINQLGEAVLGEGEARRRIGAVLERLADPEIDCVSVKISAIFSQIHLVAYDETLEEIKERLRELFRTAIAHRAENSQPKFVNLDMEEYRDLHLTVDGFRAVLDEAEFKSLEAGIVLQAYLPDSFEVQKSLTAWAADRCALGGAGIKIRLVKGANLAMEKVEAAMHDWKQAPYESKLDVDANYKRMLQFACRPENAAAVRIGVASHNLFDIAYALLLREENGVADRIEFEMLEGMANAQASVVKDRAGGLLVYAPVVKREHFQSAIAYLVRRLEENTAPKNFLRDLFDLREGSAVWEEQKSRFLESCDRAHSFALASTPNRRQYRLTEKPAPDQASAPFRNAADTDFSMASNRDWIKGVIGRWSMASKRPYSMGNERDVDRTLETAVAAQHSWEALGIGRRAEILRNAASVIAQHRGDTIGCMMLDGSKAVVEADAEVSEAIDFANYYARSLYEPGFSDGVRMKAVGVVLVTPPWNFPYAIPAGGCLAALMAGNSVILKPALETVMTARRVAEHLWEAGVPRDVLQFLTVPENDIGKRLVADERVNTVILTGAYDTARKFHDWKPELRLSGETSGKNCLVITQAADLDLAIKDLVRGAFGHAGQKCSATSLALVEAPVYEDATFQKQLRDAAESLHAGTAFDPASVLTPLVQTPGSDLRRALTKLDPGERWLLKPRMIDGNPRLWSPGIRLGVRPGSWFHRTECFGPVLGVIRVRDLNEAISVQNQNAFGLTGGIHSLDEKETAHWAERVEVGNAYINRSTTGAIVQRQPFGGWKRSRVGTGAKAGGPNYVASFAEWSDSRLPECRALLSPKIRAEIDRLSTELNLEDQEKLVAAAESYSYWWREHFSREHDPSQLFCERNVLRYRPKRLVIVRSGDCLSRARIAIASRICGVAAQFVDTSESDNELSARLRAAPNAILRTDRMPAEAVLRVAHQADVSVHIGPVLANPQIS
jgi:RHH-type proline utilization regulon transcriptional repressor/proline dehydrogenase/delta 1-pyrroline-5-carboxylate dehydrogenase